MISNINYTTMYSKTWPSSLLYIQLRRIQNPFKRQKQSCGGVLCQSLIFSKVVGLRPTTLLKKRLWHKSFPVSFAKFPRTPFLTKQIRWLLLKRLSKRVVSLEVTIFTKNSILEVSKGSEYIIAQ